MECLVYYKKIDNEHHITLLNMFTITDENKNKIVEYAKQCRLHKKNITWKCYFDVDIIMAKSFCDQLHIIMIDMLPSVLNDIVIEYMSSIELSIIRFVSDDNIYLEFYFNMHCLYEFCFKDDTVTVEKLFYKKYDFDYIFFAQNDYLSFLLFGILWDCRKN